MNDQHSWLDFADALPGTGKDGLPTINDAKEALDNVRTALSYIETKLKS